MAVENLKKIQIRTKIPNGRTVLYNFRTTDDPAQFDVEVDNEGVYTINTAPVQAPPDYYTEDQKAHF